LGFRAQIHETRGDFPNCVTPLGVSGAIRRDTVQITSHNPSPFNHVRTYPIALRPHSITATIFKTSVRRDLRRSQFRTTYNRFCGSVRRLIPHRRQENEMNDIKRKLTLAAITASSLGLLFQLTVRTSPAQPNDAALIAKAKLIHEHVIKLDTHNDIEPSNFTPDCNYTMRLTTQVNLPKMVEGGMDVSFMIAYVGQGPLTPEGYDNAYRQVVAKFDAVHRLTEKIAPDSIGLALTPADVLALHKKHLRIAVIGVENEYPIGTDIKRVQEFYDRGGRYMSLAHNGNSQLADSNTGEAQGYLYNNGLSPLGRQVIAEMNRVGMMVDLSHPSKGANMEAMRLSKAPVIASHSGVRALADVSRNMDDEQLLALKKNGGVIQIVGFASYVKTDSKERLDALAKLRDEFGLQAAGRGGRGGGGGGGGRGRAGAEANTPRPCPVETPGAPAQARGGRGGGRGRGNPALDALPADKRAEYDKQLAEIDAKFPPAARANVKDFVNHIDYAVKLIGIDHVGISSDFDGGGGIDGWNSATEAFNVTLELVRRGYTEDQIGKLWSGNLLRVWGEVQKIAQTH
jgi:membrane dipeptidase